MCTCDVDDWTCCGGVCGFEDWLGIGDVFCDLWSYFALLSVVQWDIKTNFLWRWFPSMKRQEQGRETRDQMRLPSVWCELWKVYGTYFCYVLKQFVRMTCLNWVLNSWQHRVASLFNSPFGGLFRMEFHKIDIVAYIQAGSCSISIKISRFSN